MPGDTAVGAGVCASCHTAVKGGNTAAGLFAAPGCAAPNQPETPPTAALLSRPVTPPLARLPLLLRPMTPPLMMTSSASPLRLTTPPLRPTTPPLRPTTPPLMMTSPARAVVIAPLAATLPRPETPPGIIATAMGTGGDRPSTPPAQGPMAVDDPTLSAADAAAAVAAWPDTGDVSSSARAASLSRAHTPPSVAPAAPVSAAAAPAAEAVAASPPAPWLRADAAELGDLSWSQFLAGLPSSLRDSILATRDTLLDARPLARSPLPRVWPF